MIEVNVVRKEGLYMLLNDKYADYIKDLLNKASDYDAERKIFGSRKHQYKLNPIISEEEVKNFEKEHQITLPEEYRFFLTKIGNGGAGPDYGIFPLEDIMENEKYCMCKKAFIDVGLADAMWDYAMGDEEIDPKMLDSKMLEELSKDNDTYDTVLRGVKLIGSKGCTYSNLCIINGIGRGQIVYMDWNVEPELRPFFTRLTFMEWYEKWLTEILIQTS
ncbi:SMI1/KNR4 family protein [Clostridium sp. JS66]|uniref:SMI1/KNR4 family protein n=1 Tax=Clostridium sp. JS66 TaxID=3064705 RepID=UPI00298E812B|nr:SMI1/KNR4 family protein [Clostridium sp. JS66]WPC40108.1 SMI1/KNR4 family protein [Clostridium sp. JS66]